MHKSDPPRSPLEPTVRFQTQAVLRRTSRTAPLALVGITLDSRFYPSADGAGVEPLVLTKGLVALAPLTAVDARNATDAAVTANADARESWQGLLPPSAMEPSW